MSRVTDGVWARLQEWTIAHHPEQLDAAVDELLGDERRISSATGDLLCSYMHLDRALPGGGTPAERFAELATLTEVEHASARRLSGARLGLWRVRAVARGVSIELEEVLGARVVTVRSANVSRGCARWDVLLGRVIGGADGHELWGPAVIFTAAEEEELVAEVQRLAAERSIEPGAVFRTCACQLLRFTPPSRATPPSFFTFEGDEPSAGHARWVLEDDGAIAALEAHPDLLVMHHSGDGEGICLEWTRPRRELAARRPELPPGALLLESSPVFVDPEAGRAITDASRVGLGTFKLRPRELTFDAISVPRLDGAIALVAEAAGPRARLVERRVEPFEPGGEPRASDADPTVPPDVRDAIVGELARARFLRMLDEPDARFNGLTPREAARSAGHRPDVERWLRTLENTVAHGAAAEGAAPDVRLLRTELDMPDESLADAA